MVDPTAAAKSFDAAEANDALKGAIRQAVYAIGDEARALAVRAAEKEQRLARGRARAEANERSVVPAKDAGEAK